MQKNRINNLMTTCVLTCFFTIMMATRCQPIREFQTFDTYQSKQTFEQPPPSFEAEKQTVVLIADNEGTEIFDLLAPFYLFNATGQANVYILAPENKAIVLRKGLFIFPHDTFESFDQKGLTPNLIVIPNLSTMKADSLNPEIIDWISSNYDATNRVLSVCDGALAAAATGLYDDQPITTHASDLKLVSKQFNKPKWVKDVSVTQSGRLYSTAGVSHAVEGSLEVIRDMFGEDCMRKVMKQIDYPYAEPKSDHQSVPISFAHKLQIVNKVLFKGNRRLGVLLYEGVSEFELAAVLDTYHRTFPASIKTFAPDNYPIRSANGLKLIPTGQFGKDETDEMHLLRKNSNRVDAPKGLVSDELISHSAVEQGYIFDDLLSRIEESYGPKFRQVVAVLLDYSKR
jgi:transcriptional regulator GlxA family with amidase domain